MKKEANREIIADGVMYVSVNTLTQVVSEHVNLVIQRFFLHF